jgi:hypothetical protein
MPIDSGKPTWPTTLPSARPRANSSGDNPTPWLVGSEVVAARGGDGVDPRANAGECHHQQIEHEAWVDAGAEDAHAVRARERVDALGLLGRARRRPRHFLGDRDHVHTALHQLGDLGKCVGQLRAGGLDRDVGPRALDESRKVGLDRDADGPREPDRASDVRTRAFGPPPVHTHQ